jgi:3-oxoacyl-[acyl-carrier protein] reductase
MHYVSTGKIGFEGSGFYSASKFGLVGLNESLYRELAKSNVKVTALCPGWVNTDMALASAPISGDDMIQPEDLAKSIEYLLSLSKNTVIKELVIECKGSIA